MGTCQNWGRLSKWGPINFFSQIMKPEAEWTIQWQRAQFESFGELLYDILSRFLTDLRSILRHNLAHFFEQWKSWCQGRKKGLEIEITQPEIDWKVSWKIKINQFWSKMTKNCPSLPRNLIKSENSPVLLYNFFRPRLRRGPSEEHFSITIVSLSIMLRRLWVIQFLFSYEHE